jgi:ubiquinone/menaquinone biosynthesis C-methylase UbiE
MTVYAQYAACVIRLLESNADILKLFQRGLVEPDGSETTSSGAPKILDLCCGQGKLWLHILVCFICVAGRHTLLLAERYPFLRLHGHDQSAYLISLARERATHLPKAPHRITIPQFTIGDCRSIPYDNDEIDFVMIMGNSFGYFSANDGSVDGEEVGLDASKSLEVSQ